MTIYKSSIGIRPINDKYILVDIYDDGGQGISFNGKLFIIPVDTKFGPDDARTKALTDKHKGIRPRWGKVVGTTDVAEAQGLVLGSKVLLDTLKWARGVEIDPKNRPNEKVWRIPVVDVSLVDDDGFTEADLEDMEGHKHMAVQP